jgi:hypothetical protein
VQWKKEIKVGGGKMMLLTCSIDYIFASDCDFLLKTPGCAVAEPATTERLVDEEIEGIHKKGDDVFQVLNWELPLSL